MMAWTRQGARVAPLAAAVAGLTLGTASLAGGALLLFTDDGLLGATALLLALVLVAAAAGVWAGLPVAAAASNRGRWAVAVFVFGLAAILGELWMAEGAVRAGGFGRAIGVFLFLAAPSYAIGLLLAALDARARGLDRAGAVAIAALVGVAVGVLLAATTLVPKLDPGPIYLGGALLLAATGMLEIWSSSPRGGTERRNMVGKVAIVTGVGSPGQVGFAVARELSAAGARVVVTDVSPGVEACAAELGGEPGVAAVRADLTRAEGAERVVAEARERFGRLDVLVNVAGGLTVIGPIAETTDEEWARELDRNARTAFVMSRAALGMLRERGGSIVNFAAPAGLRAEARLGAYSAAKAAVVALTRALALEEKERSVRVNAIAPGMVDTAQNREAVGDPDTVDWVSRDEIARVVVFLAGDASSGVTGETIHVPG